MSGARLIAALTALACGAAIGCRTEAGPPPGSGELDCAWVADPSNCWRTFVRGVDDCLGNAFGDAGSDLERGTLDDAATTCVYESGRVVTSETPLTQGFGEGERTIEVWVGEALCLRFAQGAGATTATSGDSTVSWQSDGREIVLTCPDGRVLQGDDVSLIGCLDPRSGGIPGFAWSATESSAYLSLLGMRGPAYACARALDAGVDAADDAP